MKQELEEKNRILSVISAKDELTQLLNRRGFMEKALETIRLNKGKNAWLMFADIDHLKEINDCFGHAEGDFAIKTAADYLRYCMPADTIIARIGGDEYVALVVMDGDESACGCDVLTAELERFMKDFNKNCDKPYYVEMSAGLCNFICDANTNLTEMLSRSDEVLYEKKKKRRATIKKEAN
jgi:diguanylate cyclase (GGDEF)-like protein